MRVLMLSLVLAGSLGTAMPAIAQTSIRGVELSPTDAARVDRQCDVLRFRMSDPVTESNANEAPPDGTSVTDPSSRWADHADPVASALSAINLDTITVRDCRAAGFYD